MVAISQMIFSYALLLMKGFVFWYRVLGITILHDVDMWFYQMS